ncbi:GAF domain-containing sensor histidine kinase [Alteromonas sp. A081]|uniref:GAF domain-containing sensor histidine kinase n=1 Tax=Alteromonas sp. A081 TaxID=3410269 RepID=UPI003B9862E0
MSIKVPKDISVIHTIDVIPHIMEMLADLTGLRFICVARVTKHEWTVCSVLDRIEFNLNPGDKLDIQTTFCHSVRTSQQPIVIEHASEDPEFKHSPIPEMYGFESYFSFPIYDTDGNFFGTICGLDPRPAILKTELITNQISSFAALISRQIIISEALEDTKAALFDEQSAAKLREQFIAILGHDIRTPLSSLKMGIDFLYGITEDDTAKNVLAHMDNSAKRMSRLISDVMDFTHGKMGSGIPLNLQYVDNLNNVLLHTVSELKLLHEECSIHCNINIVGPVHCDPERISQVLSNLLINAIVHGDITRPIQVNGYIVDTILVIRISNHGDTMSPDAMSRLFQPFWRQQNQRDTGGLGLGLFIASQISSAHNGTLSVESDDSITEFSLKIPIE